MTESIATLIQRRTGMGLTDEQKAMRRTGIGASEVAAIMGKSPWASALDIWRAKVEGLDQEETPAMKRGRILEPAVCQFYLEESGALELTEPGTLRHGKEQHALATPDRIARFPEGNRVVQAKTSRFDSEEWGQPGTDEVPACYILQTQLEMAITGLRVADLPVLMGGADFRIYRIEADSTLQEAELEAIARFWRDHVETKRPPPPDATESYQDWLSQRYPAARAPLRNATQQEVRLVAELRLVEAQAERRNTRVNELRNLLRASIGEAEGLEHPEFRVTWRKAKDSTRTDWKAVAQELKAPTPIIEKHTETIAGGRRLLVRYTGEQS